MSAPTENSPVAQPARSPRALTFAVWGLLTAAGVLDAAGALILPGSARGGVLLYQDLGLLALWALAAPAIVLSGLRFPVRGRHDVGRGVLHLTAAVAFVTTTNVLVRLPLFGDGASLDAAALTADTLGGLARFGPVALLVYAVFVAAGQLARPRVQPAVTAPATIEPRLEPSPVSPAATTDTPADHVDDRPSEASRPTADRVVVREWNRVHLVRPDDIEWIEADDNNVVVHTRARTYKGRGRISDLASQLDAGAFVRIHRSAIVHVTAVREVQPLTKGDLAVVLHDGKVLRVARGRRAALEESLGVTI